MLSSIGNAPAARPAREETLTTRRPGSGSGGGNDAPDKDGGFDQVFASAAKADDGRSDNATHEGQSNGPQKSTAQNDMESGSPQPFAPVAVNKQAGLGQEAVKVSGLQMTDVKTAIAPLVSALGILASRAEGSKEDEDKIPPTSAKRHEKDEKPAGDPSAGDPSMVLGGMSSGAPLGPSSAMVLLSGGAARPASPAAEPAIAATNGESSPEKETPLISGVAPRPQVNVGTSGADLAFALRLSRGAQPAPGTDVPAEAAGAVASVNTFVKELETAADKTACEIKTRIGNESATAGAPKIVETRTPAPAANEPGQAAPATRPVFKAEAPELPATSSAPVRAVRVELASDGNQRVALTLVERGGALSVSVHSADSRLARSLQEHLPDLSARLSEQRYQTEIWAPRVEAPDAAGAGESAHHDSESGGGMQGGADRNPNPGEQQGRGNREAPEWFEELAAIGRRPPTRSEYLWVQ